MSIETNETFGTKVCVWIWAGAAFAFLGSVTVFLYQVYLWAKYGVWGDFSTVDALKKLSSREGWPWLWSPSDWWGIHLVLERLPLWGGLILISVVLVVGGVGIAAMVDRVTISFTRWTKLKE